MTGVRTVIQETINEWFGRPVIVGERAMQILETARSCEDGWIDDAEIVTKAIELQPALTDVFIRSGISEETMASAITVVRSRTTFGSGDYHPSELNLGTTLGYQLSKGSAQFKIVRSRGRLGVTDLIKGLMRTSIDGEVGSVLVHHLLDAAGLQPDYWNPRNRKYVADVIKRVSALERLDLDLASQQFLLFWDGSSYRFRPFGAFGAYEVPSVSGDPKDLWSARGNVLQPSRRFAAEAFEELEYLISKNSPENQFQAFFEHHPEFLLALGGGKYVNLHPQLVLHQDGGRRLIPDFFLECLTDNLCDLCDLKRATKLLTQQKRNRPSFRAAIYEGIAQLEYYRNWFEDRENRQKFFSKTGLCAYRPRIILIIGRSLDYYTDIDRIRTEGLLPGHAEVITYDDLLDRARTYVRLATL